MQRVNDKDSLKTCIFIFKLTGTTYIICTYQKRRKTITHITSYNLQPKILLEPFIKKKKKTFRYPSLLNGVHFLSNDDRCPI